MATRRTRAIGLAAAAVMAIGAGGAAGAAAGATAGTTLHLSASKTALAFNVKTLKAKPGKVTLVMTNPSSMSHDVALKGGGLKAPVVGKIVGKGGTSTVSATLKKGTYEFYCSVPGHEQAGMKGTLTVT